MVGVPRETAAGERRVALVPKVVERLRAAGLDVVVETEAGLGALIPDAHYVEAGASIGDPWSADVVVKVTPPTADEIGKFRSGATLVGFLAPLTNPDTIAALKSAGVTGFAMESVPRISRAQSMDALSSQSNVAGYRAALIGAQWLDLGIEAAGEGGYARALSDEERAEQQRKLTEATTKFDVVITTALVPGRPAPRLVTAEAVEGMRAGSVIVDLAGETGGNCELTEPGKIVVKHDVTIASPLNLPATMPEHASELYARNVWSLLELMVKDGRIAPDFTDEVLAKSCVTREA